MHGVKRLFAWMIPRFDRERFRVSLVSLRKKDLSEDTLEQVGVDVSYLHKSRFDPTTCQALMRVIDRQRADVLHLHGYGATTFGRMVAAWRRLPAVVHEHANLTDTPWFQKVADRLLAGYTDLAIAVSRSTADFVVNARLIPAERTKVVYLGAPLDEFARPRGPDEVRQARKALAIPAGVAVVGTVTRLMPSKGNQYFIEAAKYVSEQEPSVRFYVVGEGELRPALEAQARELGIADQLTFTGFQRDVAAVLSVFDVVVFPSLWEGTPLTAFEALAMGKPLVTSDADGLADILTPGRDALMVPRRDGRGLGEAIVRLLRDPALRTQLSAAARATGRGYDITQFVRKMERLYELLHDTSRRTRRAGVLTADLDFLSDGTPR